LQLVHLDAFERKPSDARIRGETLRSLVAGWLSHLDPGSWRFG
jgi:hypothetical protein